LPEFNADPCCGFSTFKKYVSDFLSILIFNYNTNGSSLKVFLDFSLSERACLLRRVIAKSVFWVEKKCSLYRIYSHNLRTFFPRLAAEKSGCVKYADFLCGGLDLGFMLV
jgi:hypothetical protein